MRDGARALIGLLAVALLAAVLLFSGGFSAPDAPEPNASVSVTTYTTADDVEVLTVNVSAMSDAEAVRLVGPRGDVVDETARANATLYAYPARTGTYRVLAVRGGETRTVRSVSHACTGFCPDVVVDAAGPPGVTYTDLALAAWHAHPGETLYVRNGTYYETYVGLGVRGQVLDGLSIVGQSRSGVVIEGDVNATQRDLLYVEFAENVSVSNLTLRADGDSGLTTYGSNTTVSNVTVTNVGSNALQVFAPATVRDVRATGAGNISLYVGGAANGTTVRDAHLSGGMVGAYLAANATDVSFARTAFTNASRHGLYVEGDATAVGLTAASFYGNGEGAVYNADAVGVLDATGSYWGATNVTADCTPVPARLDPDPERVNASNPRCAP
ncbi:right-handed parallel beta-helix repeat-containing protein [Halarchaeum sp. CBA1220]|uniref:right-handed parallel beta-helix repeat-containing protein n=1 Tax=Halarchaeum sp. CBA1220 TaxID=1853682 RepID=UPI000F3AA7EF|nr:right-handed parallel beta-helix repeat-containing protein [Halarchaeum sp. CBA1220]QLC34441.1 right-handed parallel beta-helix repeat-containing protein [Halarchaeum sp. CBA1220]